MYVSVHCDNTGRSTLVLSIAVSMLCVCSRICQCSPRGRRLIHPYRWAPGIRLLFGPRQTWTDTANYTCIWLRYMGPWRPCGCPEHMLLGCAHASFKRPEGLLGSITPWAWSELPINVAITLFAIVLVTQWSAIRYFSLVVAIVLYQHNMENRYNRWVTQQSDVPEAPSRARVAP